MQTPPLLERRFKTVMIFLFLLAANWIYYKSHKKRIDEATPMSTHNIYFIYKLENYHLIVIKYPTYMFTILNCKNNAPC